MSISLSEQSTQSNSHIQSFQGLSESEVLERRSSGKGNVAPLKTSRSYLQIIRANVFTTVNTILFVLGITLIILGQTSDALVSVSVVFFNVLVSVVQELRAKHTLDHIALLTRPQATAVREGQEQLIDPGEIVVGDLLMVRPGDQIVVDGPVVGDGRLEVDESQLTGESNPISKHTGDVLYSGSFCLSGIAYYQAEKVGRDSIANQLTAGARSFRRVYTPLQRQLNVIIQALLVVAIFFEVLLAMSSWINHTPFVNSIEMAVVIIGIVPKGLLLAISVAYALGALRILHITPAETKSRRESRVAGVGFKDVDKGVLVQRANAVESLSNVDVLCLDKTGTLTANAMTLDAVYPFGIEASELRRLLGNYVMSVSVDNATSAAIGAACNGHVLPVREEVSFSSARKWSALAIADPAQRGIYVLGAPEMLQSSLRSSTELGTLVAAESTRGLRVVLFAFNPDIVPLHDPNGEPCLPAELLPLGMVSLRDTLRPGVHETVAGFVEAGIQLKVISGDHPETVVALAKQAGLGTNIRVVSGEELAEMEDVQLAQVAEEHTVFGRITPQQKERLVQALRGRNHYVAMVGDGVNDVLSLKQADLGIAMHSGSSATRGVADIVLLGDSFAALPEVFREGQRIRNAMYTIVQLFMIRVLYAVMLLVGTMVLGGFPFTPKQNAILTLVTEGIPALALATWAHPGALPRHSFLRSLLHTVLPAALTISLVGLGLYLAERFTNSQLLSAQSALTTFVVLCGVLLIPFVASTMKSGFDSKGLMRDWRPSLLALGLLVGYGVVQAVPPLRTLFDLMPLGMSDYALIGIAAIAWGFSLFWVWRFRLLERFLQVDGG
jgi:cation-transporting ATPase E